MTNWRCGLLPKYFRHLSCIYHYLWIVQPACLMFRLNQKWRYRMYPPKILAWCPLCVGIRDVLVCTSCDVNRILTGRHAFDVTPVSRASAIWSVISNLPWTRAPWNNDDSGIWYAADSEMLWIYSVGCNYKHCLIFALCNAHKQESCQPNRSCTSDSRNLLDFPTTILFHNYSIRLHDQYLNTMIRYTDWTARIRTERAIHIILNCSPGILHSVMLSAANLTTVRG